MQKKPSYLLIVFFVFLFPRSAFAYIDAGTVGLLLQALVGGLVAGMVFLSAYYRGVVSFIKKVFSSKPKSDILDKE